MRLVEPDGITVHALKTRITTIGRKSENDIVLAESSVSGEHAEIILQENGTHVLMDKRSTNGTYINGQRILTPMRLQDGDVIRFGAKVTLTYQSYSRPANPTAPLNG